VGFNVGVEGRSVRGIQPLLLESLTDFDVSGVSLDPLANQQVVDQVLDVIRELTDITRISHVSVKCLTST
jgi:hypothetical protein